MERMSDDSWIVIESGGKLVWSGPKQGRMSLLRLHKILQSKAVEEAAILSERFTDNHIRILPPLTLSENMLPHLFGGMLVTTHGVFTFPGNIEVSVEAY